MTIKPPWRGRDWYVGIIILLLLVAPVGQAEEPASAQQMVTLNATLADAVGEADRVTVMFGLAAAASQPNGWPNLSSLPPQPTSLPEPSTLVLETIGLL